MTREVPNDLSIVEETWRKPAESLRMAPIQPHSSPACQRRTVTWYFVTYVLIDTLTKTHTLLRSSQFFPNVLFLFQADTQNPKVQLYLVIIPPRASLGCDRFSVSLFLMTLTILRSPGQVFHRMFLSWHLSDVFLINKTGVVDQGQDGHTGKIPHIIMSHCQHDSSLSLLTLII